MGLTEWASPQQGQRIGVYVCHCGTNIAAVVDVEEVADYAAALDGVVVSRHYAYMCSDPGQALIKEDIRGGPGSCCCGLLLAIDARSTFRRACAEAGLNPYLFQMTNIREHCSWVSEIRAVATEKAQGLVSAAVRRVASARASRDAPGRRQALGAGRGRRNCRHRGCPAPGRCWQARLPGRAPAKHRRAHGPAV